MQQLPFLYVAPSPLGGRGVFTGREIPAGSLIETAPVIVLSAADRAAIHETHLHDYYFQWYGDRAAIALGLGSIYNHSDAANTEFACDYGGRSIFFTALRDIGVGEEGLVNYRVGDRGMELWF